MVEALTSTRLESPSRAAAVAQDPSLAGASGTDPLIGSAGPRYVYGIVRAPGPTRPEGIAIGTTDGPIGVIAAGAFAALVSDIEDHEIEPARRHLLAHTRVLEAAMRDATVLPVRFGTIADDAATVHRLLLAHAAELEELHAKIAGRVELGLKASWSSDERLRSVVERHPDLRRTRDELARRSAGETYYQRIDLGRRIEDALDQEKRDDARRLLDVLEPLAQTTRRLKPVDDRMVLNAAFLVPVEQEAAFDAAVETLERELGERMTLRYVGPVPTYNFVDLAIQWRRADA